ncbi:MAG: crosslink repair DNA glycosylase YcaQ family protein [Bacteroidia bacterium]
MKNTTLISKEEAIAIALHAQGIGRSFGKGKTGALNAIRHLGYVQLDTLAVVARAHHHTLWNRTQGYTENHLHELMREKKIFEYWSHAAAFLPMEDFRFSLVRKQEFILGRKHWFAKDKKIHKYVLDKIKAEGALQSKDFETDKRRGSWFDWKPAKIALEQLFQDGSLMIVERKGFQKVYDLTERVLPATINTTIPSKKELAEHLIRSTIRAHGFASLKDMTHLRKGMNSFVAATINKMLLAGEISEIKVDRAKEIYYQLPPDKLSGRLPINKSGTEHSLAIISPFDNLIIRRERLKSLFEYDFMLECYLPEHKRKFGYFCLPVLYKNKFIGKFDPKADRSTGIFYVKSFYLEHAPDDMDEFLPAFASALKSFAEFNGCDKIVVEKTFPTKIKAAFRI